MEFEDSLANGPHALLARLAGNWNGTCKTWFEPGKLADTQPISGRIRRVLGGRFVKHSYKSRLMGQTMRGHSLIGFDLARAKFIVAWADSCHNGTTIMNSIQDRAPEKNAFSVLGSYPDGQGGPDWGWRTEYRIVGDDEISVKHFNIPPKTGEALAVEIKYTRA
ncbi:hypothetical protein PLCT1_01895 [Planctomycetaceae bacterium]|nr:hypothetical protein PLCT1_01895 [Planctomycetaceae bacterium]